MESTLQPSPDLPEDVAILQEMVRSLTVRYERDIQAWQTRYDTLQEQVRLLLAKRFGPSSERYDPSQLQLGLFNEAEVEAASAEEEPETETGPAPRRRGRPVRPPLPPELPREEVIHELSSEERVCGEDGSDLVEIGRETSEQLDIVPAQVRVIRHVRIKYGCPRCHEGVKTAPLPPQPLPKSMASAGMLAYVLTSKYADGLPLYRLEGMLGRIGVEIPRSTLASWAVKAGTGLVQPLINLMQERALASGYIQMDETPVQVLKEPGRKPTAKSYMWVWRTGPPAKPIILFDYDPSRSQSVPERLLMGFKGYLQSDGYSGYLAVTATADVVAVGCFAHARRKFDEAVKSAGKKAKPGVAHEGLALIQELYRVERQAKDAEMTPEQRHALRQEWAVPILERLRIWLHENLPRTLPSGATGKALGYLSNQWQRLVRYLEDGRLEIDNNRTENAIRPFVVGRKGWLFSASVNGAKASANIYSLIETAKANGHEPYHYLRYVLERLPACQTVDAFEALLPMNISPTLTQPPPPVQDGVA